MSKYNLFYQVLDISGDPNLKQNPRRVPTSRLKNTALQQDDHQFKLW